MELASKLLTKGLHARSCMSAYDRVCVPGGQAGSSRCAPLSQKSEDVAPKEGGEGVWLVWMWQHTNEMLRHMIGVPLAIDLQSSGTQNFTQGQPSLLQKPYHTLPAWVMT